MFNKIKQQLFCSLFILAIGFFGCANEKGDQKQETAETKSVRKANAQMNATSGNNAHGTVTFTEVDGGVRVTAHFEGTPEGEHGFHIHENGDCSSGDGKSAGGHFNPGGNPHAGPTADKRHVGDLGNISANAEGVAELDYVDSILSFEGQNSILGKGVILHAKADDMTTQPTGAAGARISCGVIKSEE